MVAFNLDANNLLLQSKDGNNISIWEIKDLTAFKVPTSSWKFVAKVGVGLSYDELEVFGALIRNQKLKDLAKDLKNSLCIVNREGYCYLNVEKIIAKDFGVAYYRLNDLFGWSKYGVAPLVTTIWNRCDMNDDREIINLVEENKLLKDTEKVLSQLEKLLVEKDEKVKNVATQLKEREELLSDHEKLVEEKDKMVKEIDLQLKKEEEKQVLREKCIDEKEKELKTRFEELEEELRSCEKPGKEILEELKEKDDQLIAIGKLVLALKLTIRSLLCSLLDLNGLLMLKEPIYQQQRPCDLPMMRSIPFASTSNGSTTDTTEDGTDFNNSNLNVTAQDANGLEQLSARIIDMVAQQIAHNNEIEPGSGTVRNNFIWGFLMLGLWSGFVLLIIVLSNGFS